MLLDRDHRRWIIWTVALFFFATGLYAVYACNWPDGPRGGTPPGLIFGIAGSALMIYAGLLSARKRLPRRRGLGKAQSWLRGHIWLGLLSVPLIFYHSAFRFGGLLETVLMAVFLIIIASGIVGWMLQIYLPRLMKIAAPAETIYEEIPSVCAALIRRADETVKVACGSLLDSPSPALVTVAAGVKKRQDETAISTEPLKAFYLERARPFLAFDQSSLSKEASQLGNEARAASLFELLKLSLPLAEEEGEKKKPLTDAVELLVRTCDERRQLMVQERLHRLLHGWLFLHIPLSFALLVLGLWHALTATWY